MLAKWPVCPGKDLPHLPVAPDNGGDQRPENGLNLASHATNSKNMATLKNVPLQASALVWSGLVLCW